MLIFRYLIRDLLAATGAVGFVLLLIVVSGRFVKYLAEASVGKLEPGLLFAIMGFRIPGFLELIIPLAFFIAILLSYGRLYVENEMTVLHACGIGPRTIVAYTLVLAVVMAAMIAWVSLWVSPAGLAKAETLLESQKQKADIEKILPRQFLRLDDGNAVTYTEEVTENGEMRGVFIAERIQNSGNLVLLVAEKGYQRKVLPGEPGHFVLDKGFRIQGKPGQADYQVTEFAEFGQRLDTQTKRKSINVDALPTARLMNTADPEYQAAFQWRLSIPLLVIIVSLIAVPLSKSNPRQGRYVTMLPAIFIYILYLVSLNAARNAVEEGVLPVTPGLWLVHGGFLLLALLLLYWPNLSLKLASRRQVAPRQVKGDE